VPPPVAQAPPRTPTRRRWLAPALVVALVLAAYAPTFTADFTNWDDEVHIQRNPAVVRDDGLVRAWTDPPLTGFYPATYATWWAEWRLAGGSAWLFHVDNVVLHAANVVLAAVIAHGLGLAWPWGWAVAAVWGLHPITVGTVAWVTERKNVLYVFFWLASLALYLRATERPAGVRPLPYALSLAAFAAALLSKGAAMSLFAVLPIVEWTRGRSLRDTAARIAPYVVMGLVGGLGLVRARPEDAAGIAPLADRIPIAARATWFYVGTFLWPFGLIPIYPNWGRAGVGAAEWIALAALAAALVAAAAFGRNVPRLIAAGVLLYLANAVLVVGIVWFTFFRHSYVSDHLAYLPSLGLALAFVATIRHVAQSRGIAERSIAIGLVALAAVLATLTNVQARRWHDSETLFTYALAHNPDCFMCQANLGIVLRERGELDGAAEHLGIAARLDPDANVLVNLGNVRQMQGRLEDAAALYEQATNLDPSYEAGPYDLGNVLRDLGRPADAVPRYRQALAADPDSLETHHNLALALWESGHPDEARAEFNAALAIDPDDVDTITNLARLIEETEGTDAALAYVDRAARAAVNRPQGVALEAAYATLLLRNGRTADAAAALEETVRRWPSAPAPMSLLAWIRATTADAAVRDGARAVALGERAVALAGPSVDWDTLDSLAAAYAEAGRFDDAIATERRAIAVAGDAAPEALADRLAGYQKHEPHREP
jgi:tetratricopeptide (TPR) repeat protein